MKKDGSGMGPRPETVLVRIHIEHLLVDLSELLNVPAGRILHDEGATHLAHAELDGLTKAMTSDAFPVELVAAVHNLFKLFDAVLQDSDTTTLLRHVQQLVESDVARKSATVILRFAQDDPESENLVRNLGDFIHHPFFNHS